MEEGQAEETTEFLNFILTLKELTSFRGHKRKLKAAPPTLRHIRNEAHFQLNTMAVF